VSRRLDAEYRAIGIKADQHTYAKGVERVVDSVIRDIENGSLKPYNHKNVKVIEVLPPQKTPVPEIETKGSLRKGVTPGGTGRTIFRSLWIFDIIDLIKGTIWEKQNPQMNGPDGRPLAPDPSDPSGRTPWMT